MEPIGKKLWPTVGAIVAGTVASLCCILPVVVVLLGVGSAALGAFFEPFRPYLVGLTFVFLGVAFYQAYRPAGTRCAPGEACAVPENRKTQRLILWVVAAVVLALVAFPYYVAWVL